MTDIRPIRNEEAEAFLKLLCDVFTLDFNRAYDIFFEEPYFDLNRKWALFEGNEIISILTTTPMEFGWGRAIGIAGVATQPKRRGEGHASRLIEKVLKESARKGEGAAMLFARETELYDKLGFEAIDRVIRAPIVTAPERTIPHDMHIQEVRALYGAWVDGDEGRLRRDRQRWNYYKWNGRVASPFNDGYFIVEAGVLREALYPKPAEALPLPAGTEWYGTAYMTDMLQIPLAEPPTVEMYLMGYNVPGIPQLFMTDQF